MAAPAQAAPNRALRGCPPPTFDRDCTKSGDFLLAFCIWKFTNWVHEVMTNPATRTTTALSYIAGPLVEAWKEEQLTLLECNITANIAEGNEAHWVTFETNFKNAFTNTNKKNDAYRELQALKHKDDLDTFIARFKQLVTAAELDINSHGVIELLKQGLKTALVQNVLNAPDYDPNATYTFTEMEKHICDSHLRWINSQAYRKPDQKQRFHTTLRMKPRNGAPPHAGGQNRNRSCCTTLQGGDAMDVDVTETTEIDTTHTNQQRSNKCFYCDKPGHFTKDCHKKKSDRIQAENSGRNQCKPEVKTADLLRLADMDSDQRIDMITNFLKSEAFLGKEDDDKFKIIEAIAPPGF